MTNVAQVHSQRVLESIIADLKKIRKVCAHRKLEYIPEIAAEYLEVNCDLIEFYLKHVYLKMNSSQRVKLCHDHKELDSSAIDDGFFEIAKCPIDKIKESLDGYKKGMMLPTEDNIHMLLRSLQYAKYCDLDTHDQRLKMSPIDKYGLVNPGELFLIEEEAGECPVFLKKVWDVKEEEPGECPEFLKQAWRVVLGFHAETFFYSSWLADFLPSRIMEKLSYYTTLEEIFAICREQKAFDESLEKTISAINANWRRFTPRAREALIEIMRAFGQERFGGRIPSLTKEDEQALKIRWDIADMLYADAQKKAFDLCRQKGLEMEPPRGVPQQKNFKEALIQGKNILIDLLKEKAHIDKAATMIAVGADSHNFQKQIQGRFATVYSDLWKLFRDALYHLEGWLLHAWRDHPLFADMGEGLTQKQKDVLYQEVYSSLMPFKEEAEKLSMTVGSMPLDPNIYERVSQFIKKKSVTEVKIMGDIYQNITNSNLVVRSKVEKSFNKIEANFDRDTAIALLKLAEEIHKSGNKEAAELFDKFNEELQEDEPKKSVLRNLWDGIHNYLPAIGQLIDITAKIQKLFI